MVIAPPYEFWDMADREVRVIRVTAWELGETEILPRYRPERPPKPVKVLRLHLAEGIKLTLPAFWDITSGHLISALLGYLEIPGWQKLEFKITKLVQIPDQPASARFTLEVTPIT